MKVGTMPLMVQVPEMAPIKNRITMAVVTSPMLLWMASSNLCHGVLKSHMESQMQIPAENSRDTWLAPRMASLPNMLMFKASSVTSTATGIREIKVLKRGRFIYEGENRNFLVKLW